MLPVFRHCAKSSPKGGNTEKSWLKVTVAGIALFHWVALETRLHFSQVCIHRLECLVLLLFVHVVPPGGAERHLPLLCLSDFNRDLADRELRWGLHVAPGHDGLNAVPHVFPQSHSLPLKLQHHKVPNVPVQCYQERVRPIARDIFFAGKREAVKQTNI